MPLFRRREETLQERLLREAAEAGELEPQGDADADADTEPAASLADDGEPDWDAVVSVVDPDLPGDAYEFVALPDGELIVDEGYDETQDLASLAAAVEAVVEPSYRAYAGRAEGARWDVFANRVEIVELGGLGDELELTRRDGELTFTVGGLKRREVPELLVELGLEHGEEFVVEASRLVDDLYETRVTLL